MMDEEGEDVEWLVQTAKAFLSTIKTGNESCDDIVNAQSIEDEAVVPRRTPSPLVTVGGPDWRPTLSEPILFVTPSRHCALGLVSFIGYQDQSRRSKRKPMVESASFLLPIKCNPHRTQSYAYLLDASDTEEDSTISSSSSAPHSVDLQSEVELSSTTSSSDHFTTTEDDSDHSDTRSTTSTMSSTVPYDPLFLDDPELRTGKHKTVIALPGYLASIGHFTRSEELKRELNEQFRQIHPTIDPSLSLSKIRNLKQSLIKVAEGLDLELSTVAKCFTFFEKLVLKDLVNKANRKIVAACCMALAAKSNSDPTDLSYFLLLSTLSEQLTIPMSDIVSTEFLVFAALQFDLFPPQHEYLPHLERILAVLDYSNVQEYLGERMYSIWKRES